MRKIIIGLYLLLSLPLAAQHYFLQITNKNTGKYKLLHEGQMLKIERDDGAIFKGHFESFNDSALIFASHAYVLKSRIHILSFYRPYWYFMAGKFFIFSCLYPGIAAGNRYLNETGPPLLKTADFMASGIILGIALISRQLSNRKYVVTNGKWRMKFIKKD